MSTIMPPTPLNPEQTNRWAKLTPQRQARIAHTLAQRTSYIRLVMQDVDNLHNIGACLRSAEGFGIQKVDIITTSPWQKHIGPKTVAKGASQWLDVQAWPTISQAAENLRSEGYRIYTAYPSVEQVPLTELPLSDPIAVVFGNEAAGISPEWEPLVDGSFTIPMYGMVESFNVSVCVGITLHELTRRARQGAVIPARYELSQQAKGQILASWLET